MNRSEYGSLEQYVNALRNNLIICQRVDMSVTWYQAALLLLHQTAEELPNWTTVCELELRRQTPTEYGQNSFFQLCADAIERARQNEPQFSAPPSTNQSNRKKKDDDNKPQSRKHAPPPDNDSNKWIEELTSTLPDENGNKCGYCGLRYHGITTCYYLHPEHRKQG